MNMEEIWKDVEGYIGMYQVSNMGRVRRVDRYVNNNGTLSLVNGNIMKLSTKRKGYKEVGLSKNRKKKSYMVHRLVASAFIPNPNNLPQVNHLDEDKTNNCVDNLEWCDNVYNCNYGTRTERSAKSHIGLLLNRPDTSIPVLQFTKDGKFVNEYPSMSEAARQNKTYKSHISKCCLGKINSAGGYVWKYKK